ncbi:hypothetical protein EQV77_04455 [Halobacillus fulvus]|nr:hypothetical protein EQV77_04455 [Halobacillus fulvus]
MVYSQSNVIRKIIELVLIISILAFLDQWFEWGALDWTLDPFLFVVLLFSLRYGLNIGLFSYFMVLVYHMLDLYWSGGDLFLLFYDPREYTELLFLLFVTLACGLYSTSFRERYESLKYGKEEVEEENKELKEALEVLQESQRNMQSKVLESEHTLKRIYEVGKALDQPTPELIRNEAVQIVSKLFHAEEVAIYHVDSSKSALRLRVRKGNKNVFPQTIFVDQATIYQRLFQTKTINVRTVEDNDQSPVLAGPILYDHEVKEILVVNRLDFSRLTSYEIQVMSLVLDWMSNRMEKAVTAQWKEEEKNMHPGTRIYYKSAFDELVDLQEERRIDYDVPYAVIKVELDEFEHISVVEAEILLRAYLREIDIMGYDEKTDIFYFLLPGTEEDKAGIVQERIDKVLKEKGVNYAK